MENLRLKQSRRFLLLQLCNSTLRLISIITHVQCINFNKNNLKHYDLILLLLVFQFNNQQYGIIHFLNGWCSCFHMKMFQVSIVILLKRELVGPDNEGGVSHMIIIVNNFMSTNYTRRVVYNGKIYVMHTTNKMCKKFK